MRWREGTRYNLCVPVLPLCAYVPPIAITGAVSPVRKQWLLIEWPSQEAEPTKYWLSTLPAVHQTYRSGANGEASLDHRARLRRAEAGTRTWSLRRTRLARLSPSRYPLHRGLWVPGGRTEPFFPLRSRRRSGLTRLQNAVPAPPSGLTRYAWRGIIPGPLPHSVKPSPEFCSGNSRVVLSVELPFYNTVVLVRRELIEGNRNEGMKKLESITVIARPTLGFWLFSL